MARTLDPLLAEIDAVRAIWRDADAASLSDSELIAVNERYCRMRRMLDADQTQLAAEIAGCASTPSAARAPTCPSKGPPSWCGSTTKTL